MRWSRGGWGLGILAGALLLGGCWPRPAAEPTLLVLAARGSTTITVKILNVDADLFRYSWGDGASEESGSPQASHTYAAYGVYTVTVEAYAEVFGGNGQPGPGQTPTLRLLCTLHGVVDIRPAVELQGIHVHPLSPPPWYDPDRWPADCYPASVSLELFPVLARHVPDAPQPTRAVWYVYREGMFLGMLEGLPAVLPYDWFLGPSCRAGRTAYEIRLALFLSDGTLLTARHTVYACPPAGCG